ncbi:MAG: GTP cyclohydrolase II [Bacteroidia bacterium]|nr:GTP cyclohydrolase II [Bacteroidia bacterium]
MISWMKEEQVSTLRKQSEAIMPTDWGKFNMISYSTHHADRMPHFALLKENTLTHAPVLVRIHSECLTGDLFSSHRCECGEQLKRSMELISKEGGVLIYLRQEGRGIGIINKLHAYQKQDEGYDTVAANHVLGFESDARSYEAAIRILSDLGLYQIKLLTNNPLKVEAFNDSPIRIVERVPLLIKPKEENLDYLKTKQDLMGHYLDLS